MGSRAARLTLCTLAAVQETLPGETSRTVTISGSHEAVEQCARLLIARITPREDGGMAGPGPVPHAIDPNGLHVFVRNEFVGSIIGKKGARIKEIQV